MMSIKEKDPVHIQRCNSCRKWFPPVEIGEVVMDGHYLCIGCVERIKTAKKNAGEIKRLRDKLKENE